MTSTHEPFAVIPQAEDIEAAVLGCVLLAGEESGQKEQGRLMAKLKAPLFHNEAHREIFIAMRKIIRAGAVADIIGLRSDLTSVGRLDPVGGIAYLAGLPDKATSTSAFEGYLRTLEDKAKRRHLLKLGDNAKAVALDERTPIANAISEFASMTGRLSEAYSSDKLPKIEFVSPAEIKAMELPKESVLVGNAHILRGEIAVLAGAPGAGKSRASTALAICGATVHPWFGYQVHRRFRTIIVQAENGTYRLKDEFAAVPPEAHDSILVTPPPPCGLAFTDAEFSLRLRDKVEEFEADLLVVDPWNAVARDDGQRDYAEAFDSIASALPPQKRPALLIVTHTRKPKGEERRTGRSSSNEVAGSYLLTSRPRAVFNLAPATDDPEDDRVVFWCSKNNNGQLGSRSAWYRRNGLFAPCLEFDWQEFDAPPQAQGRGGKVQEEDIRRLFSNGTRKLKRTHAARELEEAGVCGRSTAFDVLRTDGKFAHLIEEHPGGFIGLKT